MREADRDRWIDRTGKGETKAREARDRTVSDSHFKGCACHIAEGGKEPGKGYDVTNSGVEADCSLQWELKPTPSNSAAAYELMGVELFSKYQSDA